MLRWATRSFEQGRQAMVQYRKSKKVDPFLHDARHNCGTALHLRGVPLAVIAKWLGHADASITATIHAHGQPDALRAASTTLGEVASSGEQ